MRTARAAALAALSLAWAARAWAGAPGSAGAEFLKFPQGARAAAMGESHVAVADDAYAAYWNPAGLASLAYPSAAFTFNRALEGVDQQYFSFAYPLEAGSTLDVNLTRLGMSSFQGYDAQGGKTRQVGASDYALGLAYGRTVLRDLRGRSRIDAGVNLKGIRSQLDKAEASTYAADLGVMGFLWRPSGPSPAGSDAGVRLGLALRNLGPGLRFDSERAPLPLAWATGVAWKTYPRGDALTVSLDVAGASDTDPYLGTGLEYTAFRLVALRLGFKTDQDVGVGFRGGVGFRLKSIDVDYAFAGFGTLGQMHRVGLSVRLGGPVEATPPEERMIRQALERGKRYMQEGRHYDAVLEFDEVLRLDPGNRQVLELMRQAHDQLKDKR